MQKSCRQVVSRHTSASSYKSCARYRAEKKAASQPRNAPRYLLSPPPTNVSHTLSFLPYPRPRTVPHRTPTTSIIYIKNDYLFFFGRLLTSLPPHTHHTCHPSKSPHGKLLRVNSPSTRTLTHLPHPSPPTSKTTRNVQPSL